MSNQSTQDTIASLDLETLSDPDLDRYLKWCRAEDKKLAQQDESLMGDQEANLHRSTTLNWHALMARIQHEQTKRSEKLLGTILERLTGRAAPKPTEEGGTP